MKLNIYDKKKVVKTYEASEYDLCFGTVEDILNVVDLDKLAGADNKELLKAVCGLALRSMPTVKWLLCDIFPGLTEEEIRNCKIKEIARVLIDVVAFAVSQLGGDGKK